MQPAWAVRVLLQEAGSAIAKAASSETKKYMALRNRQARVHMDRMTLWSMPVPERMTR